MQTCIVYSSYLLKTEETVVASIFGNGDHPGRSLVVVIDDVTVSQVTQLAVLRLLDSNLLLRCPPT